MFHGQMEVYDLRICLWPCHRRSRQWGRFGNTIWKDTRHMGLSDMRGGQGCFWERVIFFKKRKNIYENLDSAGTHCQSSRRLYPGWGRCRQGRNILLFPVIIWCFYDLHIFRNGVFLNLSSCIVQLELVKVSIYWNLFDYRWTWQNLLALHNINYWVEVCIEV